MKANIRFEGLDEAEAEIRKAVQQVGNENSRKFVTLAAKMVEAQSAPFVPVDTSVLINSAYTKVAKLRASTKIPGYVATFGYGAEYAGYVHDGGPKNWQKGGASDQFLLLGVDAFIREDLDNLLGVLGE